MRLRFIEKDIIVMEAHVDDLRIKSVQHQEVGTPKKLEPGAIR